jgi:hypothetical protein
LLPKKISLKLRQFPWLYDYLVSIFLAAKRLSYVVSTFPAPSGHSPFDSYSNRRKLERNVERIRFTNHPIQSAQFDSIRKAANEDDEIFDRLSSKLEGPIPISFSWPGANLPHRYSWETREKDFSSIFPGKIYSYDSYSEYLHEYASSRYGITFKKGGWDCFRHIEIMAAGSIPIMPDVMRSPPFAMSHYPKRLMSLAADLVLKGQHVPPELHAAIQARFDNRLTSKASASFLLEKVRYAEEKILFLDPGLNVFPDYLSSMTVAGLCQVAGANKVHLPFGAEPLYSNWQGDPRNFHGLGFGYTKILPPSFRSNIDSELLDWSSIKRRLSPDDFIVVGDVSRNQRLANLVSELNHNDSFKIFLWGGDRAPNRKSRRWLSQLKGHLAIRETY